ncbi:hypothetical protein HCN44_005526 [Aphidius gifuensis]|uniref:Uncharacterized protein n=1 Tax=Aphidius gifuensis TaxID=684658 RepID=A0A835CVH9_APHGI|nr:uncharacterized protein LOC122847728 [Aphidius gifuensis]KAF7997249.1 hypothetical protein HCN44_005526 [Aphidius gifuensis]
MADPLVTENQDNKLTILNKKIIEIKKKIQLSEGQRKANFEECDAKKRESSDKILNLKKSIKLLQIKYCKEKNNEEAAEKVVQTSRESSVCVKKRGLEEAINRIDEDSIRLRKKLDLVKYESDKQQEKLAKLLNEYEELVNGRSHKIIEKKFEIPLKKKIISLENHLHRVSVMQMEADTVRKKYRSVRASLKSDAAFYVSSLKNLEENIKDQELEIQQLQSVKNEAIELRDLTRETLTKQEIDAMNKSKEHENVILDYRQRVEDRRLELERLERLIFPSMKIQQRDDDFDATEKIDPSNDNNCAGQSKNGMTNLEDAFIKLRIATGVTKTDDVLDRFLGQLATKEKLQKMRTTTEDEKMLLEKQRQKLNAEIEMLKFSETKNADENAEELLKFNKKTKNELQRQSNAEIKNDKTREILNDITKALKKFCNMFMFNGETDNCEKLSDELVADPQVLLKIVGEKINVTIDLMGGEEKYLDWIDDMAVDKLDIASIGSKTDTEKIIVTNDKPLFPRFPGAPTPAGQAVLSEDEDEVPTRSILKRQAQLLVDTKSRRKGFNFRR